MRTHLSSSAKRCRSPLKVLCGSVGAVFIVLLCSAGLGLRLNLSGSIPTGLYHVAGDASQAKRGDIVLACLPSPVSGLAHSRGYVPRGGSCPNSLAPVGKIIMAIPGDTVTVANSGLVVNGTPVSHSRPLKRDGAGRLLPTLSTGRYVVRAGSAWLIGKSGRSFDSRYFGPVPLASVFARVRPL
jgi:conjugative transfer signal peptidase TraF